jgi:hypothetical protein
MQGVSAVSEIFKLPLNHSIILSQTNVDAALDDLCPHT